MNVPNMKASEVEVAVIGSGTMGHGIAHSFAQHGYSVVLMDVSRALLDKAMGQIEKNLARQVKKDVISAQEATSALARISPKDDLEASVATASLVVEAVPEQLALKESIFKRLSAVVRDDCVLASNTSSLSITQLAAYTPCPERVIGMHFMNPVPMMPIVELIRGHATSEAVCEKVRAFARALDKTVVEATDTPGFISNRVLLPMINEAIHALQEGVANVQDIDAMMRLGMGHPMGPLQLADFIGLDICHSILEVLYKGIGAPHYVPCTLLSRMVAAGHLGVKTAQGFYVYDERKKITAVAPAFQPKGS